MRLFQIPPELTRSLAPVACAILAAAAPLRGDDNIGSLPLLIEEKFSDGADRWQPTDADAWKIIEIDGGKAYSQHAKSDYSPPHRSPLNIALLKDVTASEFVLEVKVKSTVAEYPHRDVCLVFGYQDPATFYYVHFGSKADKNANQVFIVNDAPRAKITEDESPGVKWTDGWHTLRIVRKTADGLIEAYFDDLEKPIMRAHDTTFAAGQIGIGTFDDKADFAEVKLWGTKMPAAQQGQQPFHVILPANDFRPRD